MKQITFSRAKFAVLTLHALFTSMIVSAQEKIVIDKQEAESWFMRNWIWVALGVLVLLILLFSGSSSRRRKTTTVVKDDYGNTRRVETTEVED